MALTGDFHAEHGERDGGQGAQPEPGPVERQWVAEPGDVSTAGDEVVGQKPGDDADEVAQDDVAVLRCRGLRRHGVEVHRRAEAREQEGPATGPGGGAEDEEHARGEHARSDGTGRHRSPLKRPSRKDAPVLFSLEDVATPRLQLRRRLSRGEDGSAGRSPSVQGPRDQLGRAETCADGSPRRTRSSRARAA